MIIRVIAAVVDVRQLRLYKEDGSTVEIPQGDHRLVDVLEKCKPLSNPTAFHLPKNQNGVAYIDVELAEVEVFRDTTFADYEANQQKAGRFTRLFRVVKNKIASIMGAETQNQRPAPHVPASSYGELQLTNEAKIDDAIADIMAHAEPVSHENFDPSFTKENETIVAVVTDKTGKTSLVPGVEALAPYMVHANKTGNSKGLEAFMSRLGACIKQRDHTVEDVLRFMERGDLPLADDGSIIAYKVLRSTSKVDSSPLGQGIFVDCHSGKVEQRVGSYVCQAESLIDKGNKSQCGTGLHIARRAYLRSFNGDTIVMVKIAPEDVIIVPKGEPDKVRAKGYHIIAKIPKNEHATLRSNEAMKGTNALKLLTQAIAGDHIGIIERIEITSAMGGSFNRIPVGEGKKYQPSIKKKVLPTQPVAPVVKPEELKLNGPKLDPKLVAKEVEAVKSAAPKTKAQEARELYVAGKIADLKAFKKAAKKSYSILGFSAEEEALILGSKGDSPITNGQPTKPGKMTKAEVVKQEEVVSAITPIVEAVSELDEPVTPVASQEPKKEEPKMTGTRAEVARALFDQAVAGDKSRWGSLWRHQKECKKSWTILGFNAKEVERIKTNKPDWI